MAVYEIPMTPQPQRFTISLGNTDYELLVRFCPPASCWVLDINTVEGVPLIAGIALVTGIDLLGQYGYLGIGGRLLVQSDTDINHVPQFNELGVTGHLYFETV